MSEQYATTLEEVLALRSEIARLRNEMHSANGKLWREVAFEQLERLCEAETEIEQLHHEVEHQRNRLENVRAALEYYAEDYNHAGGWSVWDGGAKARAALFDDLRKD